MSKVGAALLIAVVTIGSAWIGLYVFGGDFQKEGLGNTYDLAFPAAAMYMAQIDGEFSAKEKEFYLAILSRMSFEAHTQAEFKKLMTDEGNIINAIAQIENDEIRSSLVEVLLLMAIYDGKLVEEERDFLIKTAVELKVPLDINDVERQAEDYRVVIEKNIFQKAAGSTKESMSKAAKIAGQAAGNVKGVAVTARGKVFETFGILIQRQKYEGSNNGDAS